jgi:hypothetical protein
VSAVTCSLCRQTQGSLCLIYWGLTPSPKVIMHCYSHDAKRVSGRGLISSNFTYIFQKIFVMDWSCCLFITHEGLLFKTYRYHNAWNYKLCFVYVARSHPYRTSTKIVPSVYLSEDIRKPNIHWTHSMMFDSVKFYEKT